METRTESIKSIAELSGIDYPRMYREYKRVSGYEDWPARKHAREYLVFPENIGQKLSLDELSVSKGEFYTFLTNKAAKGLIRLSITLTILATFFFARMPQLKHSMRK